MRTAVDIIGDRLVLIGYPETIAEAVAGQLRLRDMPPPAAYQPPQTYWSAVATYATSGDGYEAAVGPTDFPPRSYGDELPDSEGIEAPELTPELAAYAEACEPPDPIEVLNFDKPRNCE
jgi:hypothetical protein